MSYFHLELDTRPPATPTLLINGGAAFATVRDVQVALSSADYAGGSADVDDMLIWGDVDPAADPFVQPDEGDSQWLNFTPDYVVRLSPGDGRKRIYARLRDDVCNVTPVFTDFIDLSEGGPSVEIVTPVDRGRISKTAPCDLATFAWEASLAFDRFEVRVVPSIGSPWGAGTIIPTTSGSLNTSGTGSFLAETPIITQIRGADLEAASPGDTSKVVKVFVRSGGVWSP